MSCHSDTRHNSQAGHRGTAFFQCDVVITTKHKNDESNPSQNSVHQEKQLCRHLKEQATVY